MKNIFGHPHFPLGRPMSRLSIMACPISASVDCIIIFRQAVETNLAEGWRHGSDTWVIAPKWSQAGSSSCTTKPLLQRPCHPHLFRFPTNAVASQRVATNVPSVPVPLLPNRNLQFESQFESSLSRKSRSGSTLGPTALHESGLPLSWDFIPKQQKWNSRQSCLLKSSLIFHANWCAVLTFRANSLVVSCDPITAQWTQLACCSCLWGQLYEHMDLHFPEPTTDMAPSIVHPVSSNNFFTSIRCLI